MAAYLQESTEATPRKAVTLATLQAMRDRGERIAALTCYEAGFARVMDDAGVDIMLIGDSLGMTFQGHDTTLPVTVDDIAYHTACVARGNRTAVVMADMPFGSCPDPFSAFNNAAQLMRAGAHVVKLEGGAWLADTVAFLVERAIPVCAHIGLTPQSVHQMGGFRVQGKTAQAAEKLKADALALQKAGAALIVLEGVPATLGAEISASLRIPTIGIGAGPACSGQILVMHDVLGLYPKPPKFSRNFMEGAGSVQQAVATYVQAVRQGAFPAAEHCFK